MNAKQALPDEAAKNLAKLAEAVAAIAAGEAPDHDPSQLLTLALRAASLAASGWVTGSEEQPASAVGQRVYELRGERGWSQQRLADALREIGVPWQQPTVSEVEAVRASLPLEMRPDRVRRIEVEELLGLAHVFGTTVLDLLSSDAFLLRVGTIEPGFAREELARRLTGEEGK